MRLAIDVMGGDHAPDAILKGCVEALGVLAPDDRLVLVGKRRVIEEYLDDVGVRDPRLETLHADDVIEMGDEPAKAVRGKPESSIVKMMLAGSAKHESLTPMRCDAVLSAGNTGACVSASIMHMKRLPGVHRPGIAVTIPALSGNLVLCDAGANPEPKPTHLWQYAIMSSCLAERCLGIATPRVALMNIGSEDSKGSAEIKAARDLIRATPGINYIGYIEGREFFEGVADVVITDGFVGNTLLKMAEGLAKSLFKAIAQEIFETDPHLAMQFEPVVKKIYAKNDYHEHGGAPLLGVNGICLIAHGSSEARTIKAAVRNAKRYIESGLNDEIVARLDAAERAVQPQREYA